MYNQVFKTNREIKQEGDYMFIPLPFIPEEALLYTLETHDIRINCALKRDINGYLTLQPELYANKYTINKSNETEKIKNEMVIYQCLYTGAEVHGWSMGTSHKMRLNYNHPVYLMYIDGDFNQNNVEKYVFKFIS